MHRSTGASCSGSQASFRRASARGMQLGCGCAASRPSCAACQHWHTQRGSLSGDALRERRRTARCPGSQGGHEHAGRRGCGRRAWWRMPVGRTAWTSIRCRAAGVHGAPGAGLQRGCTCPCCCRHAGTASRLSGPELCLRAGGGGPGGGRRCGRTQPCGSAGSCGRSEGRCRGSQGGRRALSVADILHCDARLLHAPPRPAAQPGGCRARQCMMQFIRSHAQHLWAGERLPVGLTRLCGMRTGDARRTFIHADRLLLPAYGCPRQLHGGTGPTSCCT